MKKVELLSPVGNMESLYMAVKYGADAVYLAGKKYGARSFAENFTEEEIINAVKYCHLYGVKIYITVNTIVYNNEIINFLKYIDFLYKNNVDALIMQDIGMISIVRKNYPDFEIHASTQMHNNNQETVKLLEKLGIKRVVMARELSLDEIDNIKTPLEKEIFVHGALCVCYSGCCLFSSIKNNRSANRGECVASCRLKYFLEENGSLINKSPKYLLSMKELNNINNIPKIIDKGINSLKIEGRMKSPEYVGFITKLYREAIDCYYNNKKYKISESDLTDLKSLYNRDFTNGYLFNKYGSDVMNIDAPNHMGSHLGKVIEVNKKMVKIKLDRDINQEDGIRFLNSNKGMIINKLYNKKNLLVSSLKKGDIAIIDNKIGFEKLDEVNKTIDKKLIIDIKNVEDIKIDVDIKIIAKSGEKLKIIIKDNDNNVVEKHDFLVEESINRPVSKNDIIKQISKLGNTPFKLNSIDIDMDQNIFIQNKNLNEIRRMAITELKEIRENKKIKREYIEFNVRTKKQIIERKNINVLVRNECQLKAAISCSVDNIYITDYELYKKYKRENVYYVLPRIIYNYEEYIGENLLVRELGSINKYSENNSVVSDYTLNIINNDGIDIISNLGVNRVCLSPEVNINDIDRSNYNSEVLVYGRLELMVTKYCIPNMIINKDNKSCNLCYKNKYHLKDEFGNIYPILHDNHISTIFDSENINLYKDIELIKNKFNNIRINLFDENYDDVVNLIKKFRSKYE